MYFQKPKYWQVIWSSKSKKWFQKALFLMLFLFFSIQTNAQKVEIIKLSELKTMMAQADGIYIFNFWATWCKPCIKEMPYFETLANDFRPNHVKVIFVSLDFRKDLNIVRQFAQEKHIESPIYLLDEPDANTWINQINPQWSGAIPATMIIKEDKKVFYEQDFDYQTLVEKIKPFF